VVVLSEVVVVLRDGRTAALPALPPLPQAARTSPVAIVSTVIRRRTVIDPA
jgi:hypothetical protein